NRFGTHVKATDGNDRGFLASRGHAHGHSAGAVQRKKSRATRRGKVHARRYGQSVVIRYCWSAGCWAKCWISIPLSWMYSGGNQPASISSAVSPLIAAAKSPTVG